jgi:hypothetical protein
MGYGLLKGYGFLRVIGYGLWVIEGLLVMGYGLLNFWLKVKG